MIQGTLKKCSFWRKKKVKHERSCLNAENNEDVGPEESERTRNEKAKQ